MNKELKIFLLSNFFSNWFYTFVEAICYSLVSTGQMCHYSFLCWMLNYIIGYTIASSHKLILFSHNLCEKLCSNRKASKFSDISAYAIIYEIIYNLITCIIYDFILTDAAASFTFFVLDYIFSVLVCIPVNILITLTITPLCDKLADSIII